MSEQRIPWCQCRSLGPWHVWEPGESCSPSPEVVQWLLVGATPATGKHTEKETTR